MTLFPVRILYVITVNFGDFITKLFRNISISKKVTAATIMIPDVAYDMNAPLAEFAASDVIKFYLDAHCGLCTGFRSLS